MVLKASVASSHSPNLETSSSLCHHGRSAHVEADMDDPDSSKPNATRIDMSYVGVARAVDEARGCSLWFLGVSWLFSLWFYLFAIASVAIVSSLALHEHHLL